MKPEQLLEGVCDRATFLQFVHALEEERRRDAERERAVPSSPYGPTGQGWQNITIEDFLESAAGWADDVSGTNAPVERVNTFPEAPSWAAFARFLYAGKVYE